MDTAYEAMLQKQAAMQGGAGRATGLTCPENRSLDIPNNLQALNDRTEVLSQELSRLESRLGAIMRHPSNNDPRATVPAPPPSFSGTTPVSQSIAQATNGVENAIFRLRMLLDLLEV